MSKIKVYKNLSHDAIDLPLRNAAAEIGCVDMLEKLLILLSIFDFSSVGLFLMFLLLTSREYIFTGSYNPLWIKFLSQLMSNTFDFNL